MHESRKYAYTSCEYILKVLVLRPHEYEKWFNQLLRSACIQGAQAHWIMQIQHQCSIHIKITVASWNGNPSIPISLLLLLTVYFCKDNLKPWIRFKESEVKLLTFAEPPIVLTWIPSRALPSLHLTSNKDFARERLRNLPDYIFSGW